MTDWPFSDAPDLTAFSTRQVMESKEPILLVTHEVSDGAWQFIGGPWQKGDLVALCLRHAVERDPSIRELADLPRGWGATRGAEGESWHRYELPRDED
jgi:hypothetical protein